MTRYRGELKIMLNNAINDFWHINSADANVEKEANRLFKIIHVVTFFFVFLAFPTSLLYSYFGIFSDDMIFLSYVPNVLFLSYNVIISIQFVFINVGVFIVTSFDILFMYLCFKSITQFQIINYRIERVMDVKNPDEELNKCIIHHVFMLE